MHTDNLEWLVTNCLEGEVNGDNPEDLTRIIAARKELDAIKNELKPADD